MFDDLENKTQGKQTADKKPVEDIFSGIKDIEPVRKAGKNNATKQVVTNSVPQGNILRVLVFVILTLLIIILGLVIASRFLNIPALSNILDNQGSQTTEEVKDGTKKDIDGTKEKPLAGDNFDTDGDGLTDEKEKEIGTDIFLPDTDGDGLMDGEEYSKFKTNPLKEDSDNDGLSDSQEILKYKTDPNNPDTDGDTYSDGSEVENGYNPNGDGELQKNL